MQSYNFLWIMVLGFSWLNGQDLVIHQEPSKNFDERRIGHLRHKKLVKPEYIIMHYTANCDKKSVIERFKNWLHGVSAHFVIGPDGSVTQMVDTDKAAVHAGQSSWQGQESMNAYSIGIEFVNPGFTQEKQCPCLSVYQNVWDQDSGMQIPGSHYYWYPFTQKQLESAILLCQKLMMQYHIAPDHVLGHSDIAPQRKTDPGPLFPWRQLAQAGIGRVVQLQPELRSKAIEHLNVAEVQTMFKNFGYEINVTDQFDKQTKNVVQAFQMHFRPDLIDGQLDKETVILLQNLLK